MKYLITSPRGYSDPRSGRVAELTPGWPGPSHLDGRKGPESSAASAFAATSAAERGGSCAGPAGTPFRRTTAEQLRAVRDSLSDRDWRILSSLDQHPYLVTLQLQRLHFADHATTDSAGRVCRRVLKRLARLRVIEHLERRIGGVRAGSASFVWRFGPVGDRLFRQRYGEGSRARRKEPSLRYLEHCLLAAETHIRLLEAGRDGRLEILRVETEPTCWRPFFASGGPRAVLKPDLYAVTATGDYEDHWFVEVDRGTESLPTLLRKCAQYEQYRRVGVEQETHGVFPRVLWLLPDEARIMRLQDGLATARIVDASLHRLTTLEHLITAVTEAAE